MKKTLIILLSIILLLQPILVLAAYDGGSYISSEDEWTIYKEYNSLDPTLPLVNTMGLKFNKELWEELGLVVYGDYTSIAAEQNDFKQVSGGYYKKDGVYGEYRYHGRDKSGNKITNIDFPDDATSSTSLENKNWFYDPWKSTSPAYSSFANHVGSMSDYNFRAITYNTPESNTIKNWINEGLNFDIKKGTINGTDTATNTDPVHYLNIQSAPTPISTGQGIMFHKSSTTGKIWYQSFPVAKIKKKLITPVEADMPNIAFNGVGANGDIEIKVRVTGKILDDEYYGDEILESAHYTRKDIKKWSFTLTNNITGQTLTMPGMKSSATEGYADFLVTIPQSKYKSLLNSNNEFNITFTGTAISEFTTGEKSQDNVIKTKTIKGTQATEVFPGEIYEPPRPEPIEFEVSAPREILDVDQFPLSLTVINDNKAVDRYVTIDNRKLSEADEVKFLNGQYKFPQIKEDRVYDYAITYVHENGDLYFYKAYVIVYDSIPSATVRIGGTHKENRKITASADKSVTSDYLESRTNVTISKFTITSKDGAIIYYGTNTNEYKEFMRKSVGILNVDVTVSNEYGSRSYHHEIYAEPDYAPDLISIIWNNNLARNESLDIFNEGASLDGDTIAESSYKIYYDTNNDGNPETLVYSGNWTGSTAYKPNKLGNYKIVFKVKEEFGSATISKYITDADKRTRTVEREFFVDNLVPMTKVYTDIEYNFPQLDVAFLIDQNYPRAENDYVRESRVDIMNNFRVNSMVANVDVWDLHTYEYTQTAYSRYHSGSSYPPSTSSYNSDGYSGTLNRYNVDNYQYTVDEGSYKYKTLSKTVTMSKTDWGIQSGPTTTTYSDGSYKISTTYWAKYSYSDSEGYSGSTSGTGTSWSKYNADGKLVDSYSTNQPTKTGTAYKTEKYWDDKLVTYNDYYGDYSGTVYKYVKQSYTPSYQTESNKYIIYMAKDKINNKSDFNYVKDIARDAKVIFIGNSTLKSQFTYDYFIPYSSDTNYLINEVIKITKTENPIINELSVLVNESFNLSYSDIDEEGDPIVEEGFKYVHDQYYFDNPEGQEHNYTGVYSGTVNKTTIETKSVAYSKTFTTLPPPTIYYSQDGYTGNLIRIRYIYNSTTKIYTGYYSGTVSKTTTTTTTITVVENTGSTYPPNSMNYNQDGYTGKLNLIKVTDGVNNESYTSYQATKFTKPGKYTIYRRVKDAPVGFASLGGYSNLGTLEITAHRKPIAKASLDWDFDAVKGIYKTTWVDQSYDPDFQYSDANKGIEDRKIKYKSSSGNWIYEIPGNLDPGTYTLEYIVMDKHGIWSDPWITTFTLNAVPGMQILDAKARPANSQFTLAGVPASENLILYDVKTRYPYDTYLDVAIYQSGVKKTSSKIVNFTSGVTGTKVGNDITWNNIYYNIPATLPDGNYKIRVTAIGTGGQTTYKEIPFTVKTPVNLIPTTSNSFENSISTSYDIKATTSKYVSSVQATMFKGTAYQSVITLNAGAVQGNIKNWSKPFIVSGTIPEGVYTIEYRATTTNGNIEYVLQQVTVISLRITGFVNHTELWNQHRIDYNLAMTGTTELPRTINVFFPGEKFILKADTLGTATAVSVEILGTAYKTSLVKTNESTWEGYLWHEDMMKWQSQDLIFRFTAISAGGSTKVYDVPIRIEDDPYWRQHGKF